MGLERATLINTQIMSERGRARVKRGWKKVTIKQQNKTETDQSINHLFSIISNYLWSFFYVQLFQLAYAQRISLSLHSFTFLCRRRQCGCALARTFNPPWVWESDGDLLLLMHTVYFFLLLLLFASRYFLLHVRALFFLLLAFHSLPLWRFHLVFLLHA